MKWMPYAVLCLCVGGVLLTLLLTRAGRTQTTPQTQSEWEYKIGLPVIPPTHPASVTFRTTKAAASAPGQQAWDASFSDSGHTARFRLELDASTRTETHGIPMKFGAGRLIAVAGSDDRALLAALGHALDGRVPTKVVRVASLPFDYVHFGDRMSLIRGGGFQFKPAGAWTAMKIFLDGATPDEGATVYLSVNETAGEAQLSMSNSDYGDDVVRRLATVL